MATNPFFTAAPPLVSDSVRAHLRIIVLTFLASQPSVKTIPDAVLQLLHGLLADPTVWALIKQDLAL
jgi:hypothetical protein